MTIYNSPLRGVPFTLQNAASTGNGTVMAVPAHMQLHTINIKGSSGVASGAIQIESADTPDYAGTWSPLGGGPITVVASSEFDINFTGTFRFIRARISTTIGSGTVTVTYIGYPYD